MKSEAMMTKRFQNHITIPVDVVVTDDLRSGGVGNLTSEIRGYVNMFAPDNVLYVEPITVDSKKTYLLSHEYAHIGQKELAAKSTLGYPSHWNPLQSMLYYQKLIKLDNALSVYYAEEDVKYSLTTLLPHIEHSADCLTQAWGSMPREDSYVGEAYCTDEQKAAALVVAEGKWPSYEVVQSKAQDSNLDDLISFEEAIEKIGMAAKASNTTNGDK
jgi:hypothetical protein